MKSIDKFFDISTVLMTVFSSLETIRDEKEIELIYEIDATVPKELKGNAAALSQLLAQILTFVFYNSTQKEIILSLTAPKDFLYEESIFFKIGQNGLAKEKVANFLETSLTKNLELLNGEIIEDEDDPSAIHIGIPFKLNELGKRRYYRLPDMAMLGKKVLLICESQKVAESIRKMFQYFLYEVDVGVAEYKKNGSDMTQYDILLIEDKLITERFEKMISKVQQKLPLKYVILQGSNYTELQNLQIESAHLIKPVMQESIFELIVSLFEQDVKDRSIISKEKKTIVNMDKYIDEVVKKGAEHAIKESKIEQENFKEHEGSDIEEEALNGPVLDIEEGKQNAKRVGLAYAKELKKFLESFDRSDVYFREAVSEKSTWKIKEFCIELEKQAKAIGAQRMSGFADRVSKLFVYDKLDTLPVYTSKYHMELKKLITEIKIYLNSQKR